MYRFKDLAILSDMALSIGLKRKRLDKEFCTRHLKPKISYDPVDCTLDEIYGDAKWAFDALGGLSAIGEYRSDDRG